ncbi:MAG: SH3 domain-containing protein [Candidatus Desantisbacteria bacterium]
MTKNIVKAVSCLGVMVCIVIVMGTLIPAKARAQEAQRLVDNGNRTVTDTETGLMWTKAVNSTKRNLSEAIAAASKATIAGYKDWRVSTCDELEEMARIYPQYLSVLDLQNGEYLTTTESDQQNYVTGTIIYVIGIHPKNKPYTGEGYHETAKTQQYVVYYNGSKWHSFYYWLVRGPIKMKGSEDKTTQKEQVIVSQSETLRISKNGNVRSGPNTKHEIIGKVTVGTEVTQLEQSGSWYKVKLPDETVGWLHRILVDFGNRK